MRAQIRATDMLVHYFREAFVAAGLNWNSDNDVEVASIVDAIDDMITAAIRSHADYVAAHAGSRS